MPAGDGRGPEGIGPMTGRGAGFCNGSEVPGNRGFIGRGGTGFGRGRGFRRMFWYGGVLPACLYFANRWRNRNRV